MPSTNMGEVTCQLCERQIAEGSAICLNKGKAEANQKNFFRCNLCNTLSSRIYRAKGRVQWESKEAKKEFFLQHTTLAGKDLKKELEHVTTQVERDTTKDTDDANIDWVDEEDLCTRYKDKPSQLNAILETAETRMHPTRKVKLYADITYNSQHSKSHEVQGENKRQCTSTEIVKGAKKPKKVKDGDALQEAPKGKPLSTGQRAKLVKLEQKMEQIKDDWNQQQQHANDDVLQSFFPKPLMEAAQKAMADVDACIAEVPVVLTDRWEGDFKGVLCRVTAAVQSGMASNARVASMIQMAADMCKP